MNNLFSRINTINAKKYTSNTNVIKTNRYYTQKEKKRIYHEKSKRSNKPF
jgi:hypothetical protein